MITYAIYSLIYSMYMVQYCGICNNRGILLHNNCQVALLILVPVCARNCNRAVTLIYYSSQAHFNIYNHVCSTSHGVLGSIPQGLLV